MNDSKISVRYSKALFELALEKNVLDKVLDDIKLLYELSRMPEIKEMLESPVVPPTTKKEVLCGLLDGKVEDITLSFVDLVIKNGRETYFPAIARRFLYTFKNYRGITESTITTAVKLDDKVVKEIKDFIAKKFNTTVDLKEKVDKDIIGGFILRVDDNYIDASVKNKLKIIEKELNGANASL